MEDVEEVAVSPPPPCHDNNNNNNNKDLSSSLIAKGKRTKRQRPHSPISFTIATPTPDNTNTNNLRLSPSFSPASSEESTTTAEVDTARCLIFLSRGGHDFPTHPPNNDIHQYSKHNDNINNKALGLGYACKTCNRVFPSFQALGGHRASHKKPKTEKKTPTAILSDEEDFNPSPFPSPSMSSSKNRFSSNSLSLQLSNISTTTFSATPKSSPSPRIHECSYCGAEFNSGQALGGHMRKHRGGAPIVNRTTPLQQPANIDQEIIIEETKMIPKNVGLSLDLNLPAPEDHEGAKTTTTTTSTGHVLTTTTTTTPVMVDCRY